MPDLQAVDEALPGKGRLIQDAPEGVNVKKQPDPAQEKAQAASMDDKRRDAAGKAPAGARQRGRLMDSRG